ncbi:MAG: hypothetical protein WA156_17925 [Methylocystis silviterrae]
MRRLLDLMDPLGYLLTEVFHLLGLFAIGGATVWAAAKAFLAALIQCAPTARVTSGGRFHPESCRLIW